MPKKKILYVATVDIHIKSFHLPYLKMMQEKGWETHVATNGKEKIPFCDHKHTICMERSPFKLNNIKAIKQMKQLLEKEHFDIIHCHTPMGSVVTRLAAKKARKNGTRVIYTAHGFHFYTGAPLINWLLFYPVEWYLAKYTDTLITINHEDYNRAKKKFSKRCRDIQYVPGVGIDPKKFDFKMTQKEKHELRASLGLKDDDFVMIFPARLDKNKNQGFLIKCMPELIKENSKIHLLLPGRDELNGKYRKLAKKLNVENNVHFLGERDDVPRLLKISDLGVSTSRREGLPVNLLEATMSKIPVVALNCRGCNDILNCINSKTVSREEFIPAIKTALDIRAAHHSNDTVQHFTVEHIAKQLTENYHKKKTVLHLLASNKYSGAENVASMIIKNTSDEFNTIYCSPDGPVRKIIEAKGILYIPLTVFRYAQIKKAINYCNPDIIHAHDYKASIYAAAFNNKIIISHIHQNNPKVRKISPQSVIYSIASKKYKQIIWVSSNSLNDYYFHKYIKNKSVILRNMIDANSIRNLLKNSTAKKQYDIAYLGRLSPEKNPKKFINIVYKLASTTNKAIKAAIIGDGEEYEAIKKIICEKKLNANIDLLGNLENPYPILNNSKILVITSVREGLPMSSLEALSLGKPIISTAVGDLPLIIKNNYNGFVSNDENKMAAYIDLSLDDNTYKKLSKNAYSSFRKYNNLSKYIKAIKKAYKHE